MFDLIVQIFIVVVGCAAFFAGVSFIDNGQPGRAWRFLTSGMIVVFTTLYAADDSQHFVTSQILIGLTGFVCLILGAVEDDGKHNLPVWAAELIRVGLVLTIFSYCWLIADDFSITSEYRQLALALAVYGWGEFFYPTKFLNSIATVTGPIPPGTGV